MIIEIFLRDYPVGTLTKLPGDHFFFSFYQDYIDDENRPILSQSYIQSDKRLRFKERVYRGKLPPFFSNLLPEGGMLTYVAKTLNIKPHREFDLLCALGQDLPGAITATVREGHIPQDSCHVQFSLAGVQLKLSALRSDKLTIPSKGGDWIIKFPHPSFPELIENEWAMMNLAKKVGLTIPELEYLPLKDSEGIPVEFCLKEDQNVLAVKRFDRQQSQRIHMEDFAQVYNLYPDKKYDEVGYGSLFQMIWILMGEEALLEFTRRFVFNVLIGNGDMHLKNISLLYHDPCVPSLSPGYDFVSTLPYFPSDELALSFMQTKSMHACSLSLFEKLCERQKLPTRLVLSVVRETAEKTKDLWSGEKNHCLLSKGIIKSIDDHMERFSF